MKKISILILVVLMTAVFALSACGGDPEPTPNPDDNDKPPIETNEYIVSNSTSGYKIVMPAVATKKEQTAASELNKFIKQASGADISVITDAGLTLNADSKYISVGNTTLFTSSGIDIEKDKLNGDGFKIITKDKSVFLNGASSYAPLYAAYEFLEQQFEYAFYAVDEIVAPYEATRKLKAFNLLDAPDFAHRNVYDKAIKDDEYQRALFRSRDNMETWGTYGHSSLTILPHATYYSTHPEWFSSADASKAQPCWINEAGRKQMTANLKDIILASTSDQTMFMVGQMDTNTVCQCKGCNAAHSLYGSPSGTMMVYINKIADDIEAWRKEFLPNKTIYIGTFAYQQTINAPAKLSGDGYVPRHPDVVARDNVIVQYAPLGACFAHDLVGSEVCNWNEKFEVQILGWKSVAKHFAIWNYSAFFTDYFVNLNNFNTLQSDYQLFKELGAVSLFCQGTGETTGTPFHNLRIYLRSALMWDTDVDVNKLTDDFFKAYYKDAYAPMKEYYNLTRMHYQQLNMDAHVYDIFGENIKQKKYWEKRFLVKAQELFDSAYSAIDSVSDTELKEKLRIRILNETFSIRFLLIDLHGGDMETEDVLALIDSFESDALEAGVTCYRENTNIQGLYELWRVKYNK